MPTTVNFRRLFDFSQLPIIITAAVLAALTIGIILMFLYSLLKDVKKKEKPAEEAPQPVFVKPDLAKRRSIRSRSNITKTPRRSGLLMRA